MNFSQAFNLPNGAIVDVAAVVVNVGPVDHHAAFPYTRELALMDSNFQVGFMRVFNQVTDFYESQLMSSEMRRGIIVATSLEVDKVWNCLSTTNATSMLFLNNPDYRRYASMEEMRRSLVKEPALHDTIKFSVICRRTDVLKMEEQNNNNMQPEKLIIPEIIEEEDVAIVLPKIPDIIEEKDVAIVLPKKKRTRNNGFTVPAGVEVIDIPSSP
ncbi:uncharacterized protein LOC102710240 [Oryza brachyantha]|uniref:uncharacterized protein LOC102710240 n=1 Tax=Oryza brachyantha TaxID=4533 RepID=UPI0003EAC9CE|nr:uncharacterized protein LOC102710240 [Oryza brachyantha]XP_040384220.1 uncharacterized protein LOC102710240 [Oryza brachyantha]